jgi:hypothetical protein
MVIVFFKFLDGGFMSKDYSKGKDNQYSNEKNYQAAGNFNKDTSNRKPNAPTHGGYTKPGTGTGGSQYQNNKTGQTETNRNPSNNWGKDSINKDRGTSGTNRS